MHSCQAIRFAKRLKSSRSVQYIFARQRVFDKVLLLSGASATGGLTFPPFSIPADRSATAFSTMPELHYPEPDVLNAGNHTATVIMIHGLGDTSAGWSPVGAQLKSQLPHVKWIFPNAPMRPITCNMGMKMPGWYDIYSMEGINSREDEEGLTASAKYVKELVEKEVAAGTPANRIVVGGFSQGGAVAIMMLREMKELAGIIGLSCYLPLRNAESGVLAPEMKDVPLFMGHGTDDPLIPLSIGQMTFEVLQGQGSNIEMKTYPMAHSACPEELGDVAAFLKRVIP